jgi:hydroxymethylglutaryl-CoA lyase
VAEVVAALFAMGAYEVSLGDTIGRGVPERVAAMLDAVLDVAEAGHLAGHFHDTGGRALDNVEAALGRGLRVFDAAVGGLGGCPFAPGAKGNVATEACTTGSWRSGSRRGSTGRCWTARRRWRGACGMAETVRVTRDGRGVARLTLARAEKHNALSAP